jgi:hypothetical protein
LEANLGKRLLSAAHPFRKRQFQIVHRLGQRPTLWLAEQQVNMLGHHYVAVEAHVEAATHVL